MERNLREELDLGGVHEAGITVSFTNQNVLEQQALDELNILSEVVVDNTNEPPPAQPPDISKYFKQQRDFTKVEVYRKSVKTHDDNYQKGLEAELINQRLIKRKVKEHKGRKAGGKKAKVERSKDDSGSEYRPSGDDSGEESEPTMFRQCRSKAADGLEKCKDDACLGQYQHRLETYYRDLEHDNRADEEPDAPDFYRVKGGLQVPFKTWEALYSYQQEGVRWLWGLHRGNNGGILGDEMGLGKTVQIIAFLAGLDRSQAIDASYRGLGPTLIICPVTVIHQWVQHFHHWAPEFRVVILHQSGSFTGNRETLVRDIHKGKGVIVTNYQSVLKYKESLCQLSWHYLVLDEGHKIRNSTAKITKIVKRIKTSHRIMLTGSPMQNNLQELWSLFDFTNPGMLGSLPTFLEHFNNPIVQGGYTNATPIQEATALQVATTLKGLITPFLLRRSKTEVQSHINLPNKTEQVLFCSLTDVQKDLYKSYLMTDHVHNLLQSSKSGFDNKRRANLLMSITNLRKICNHPDIYLYEDDEIRGIDNYGMYKKSGKMVVVSALLKIWKKQGHRVLLFTQSRKMLVVLERFLKEIQYKYLKMDGSTAVSSRQTLINKFNQDPSFDVFLLTTKTGGLGVNLTGADRVIIYDPDWNPAVDTQARERAWRIGQDKDVTIYRLLSSGTIEEKMYQRQVWKQLLSNKVLLDPKTQKFFNTSNLYDLFSLPEDSKPESTNIFQESRVKFQEQMKEKEIEKEKQFTDTKIAAMKKLAQQISRNITLQNQSAKNAVDDHGTSMSFSKALEQSEKAAESYTKKKREKKSDKGIYKSVVDKTGVVDGEAVDGLVKTETKKLRRKYMKRDLSQDEYILEKLFAKKGVAGALQHESVVGAPRKMQSLKVREEARIKADKALEALRKSRVTSWRW